MSSCLICYEPINIFFYKENCQCRVKYHIECIEKWIHYNNKCPLCKKELNIQKITNLKNKVCRFYEGIIVILSLSLFIILIMII